MSGESIPFVVHAFQITELAKPGDAASCRIDCACGWAAFARDNEAAKDAGAAHLAAIGKPTPAPPAPACSPRFALTQDAPRLIYGINGCACGATFAPAIDDNAWLAHAAAMSASGGGASPAVADCMRAVSQPPEESDGERAVRAMKLQWARDVIGPPHPTTMPSLAVRLGTTHDDLMRAAIAWALADRVADANADIANTCAHSLSEAKERLATVEANTSIGFDPVHESEQVAVMEDRYNRASIALDISSAAEQKADEALRAIAKRLLAELGL